MARRAAARRRTSRPPRSTARSSGSPTARASWQFGSKAETDDSDKPSALPTFGTLRVGDGHVAYNDAVLPAGIDARFALSDGSAPGAGRQRAASAASGVAGAASSPSDPGIVVRAPAGAAARRRRWPSAAVLAPGESGLRLNAVGQYRKLPVLIDLRTAGVLGLFAGGKEARAQPLRLMASIGRADLTFDGSTTDPLHFAGLKGRFTSAGPSLAAVGDPLGVTLADDAGRSRRAARWSKDGDVWKAVFDRRPIGSSQLNGAFTYDQRPKVPLLSGRLGGARLVLADLGPAVGTPTGSSDAQVADQAAPATA